MSDNEIVVTGHAWLPLASKLVRGFEGCERKRKDGTFEAYADPATGADPWTIGWGSTGPDIKKGTVWTQEQCDARFSKDLLKFGEDVKAALGGAPTKPNEMAALVSFAYNVKGWRTSTLFKLHRAGDRAGAKREFAKWNHANGKVMGGLTRRRAAEAAMYGGEA